MARLLGSTAVVLSLLSVGCRESVLEPRDAGSSPVIQAASAPTVVPIFIRFDDVNPCTGLVHTITVRGTARIVEQKGVTVVHSQRTITTSSGFTGRGTETDVDNGNIFKFTLNDMLTNQAGDRIRAHLVLVLDLSTDPPTVRVMQGTFNGVLCISH
jgi:hypothetical protein